MTLRFQNASFADLPQQVLGFWFGSPDAAGSFAERPEWFRTDPAFDAACANRFAVACREAIEGRLNALAETADGALALILLLDQLPRNVYRGTRMAYAGDTASREIARVALARRYDNARPAVQRLFFYLPFEHSESVADQERACWLIAQLGNPTWLNYAEQHRDVIRRFGRFPQRNRALGRPSTAEELAFLAAASGF